MPSPQLKNAVEELSRYFALYSLRDVVGADLALAGLPEQDIGSGQSKIIENNISLIVDDTNSLNIIGQKIVDAQTGGKFTREIIDEITLLFGEEVVAEERKEFLNRIPIIYQENFFFPNLPTIKQILGSRGDEINNSPNLPSRDSPSLAVYNINTIRVNPASRNTGAATIFLNSVPTIELSRCVPYLNVQFQIIRPPTDISGRPLTMSLIKFLDGANNLENNSVNNSIHTAQPTNIEARSDKDEQGNVIVGGATGFSGMELFTSPQTLVNADPDNSELSRVSPVIDKFRPFMSIEEFEVQVVPTTGVMSYKTATMKIILHDRSRLSEIAEFIKPDMTGFHNIEMLIEYGWSHPDLQSPYGKFLNSMRKKEKYSIRNHKARITNDGQVEIELELYMKGALDSYNTTINDGGQVGKTQQQVVNLQKRISELKSRLYNKQSTFVKELRGTQILSAASDISSNLSLSRDLRKELRKNLSSLENVPGDDARELKRMLQDLYGKDGKDGLASGLLKTIAEEFQERMKLVTDGKTVPEGQRTPDPWIHGLEDRVEEFDLANNFRKSDYVSFGKLATLFIGQPLAASKKFDEVQLLFYPFNDGAGFARHLNISSFSIEISRFERKFAKIRDSKRTIDLSIRDFVQFMTNNFFDDPASLDYGMRRFYTYEKNKKTGSKEPRSLIRKSKGQKKTDLRDEYEERIRESGVPNGTFKMAHLDVYFECVPSETLEGSKNSNDHRSILRIHFFDRVATPFSSLGDLLRALRDEDIGSITRSNVKEGEGNTSDHEEVAKKIIQQAKSMGLIEADFVDGSGSSYRLVGGPRKVKEFISNTMPSIIFSSNGTAVNEAGLKTMHDPRLGTVNMLRSGDASPLTPSGAGQGGIPLWVHPAQMDMEIFGCPIIEFMQSYFVDFQTYTTFDNIYNVTKLTHRFRAGEFNTSISFTPADAYPTYRALSDKIAGANSILSKIVSDDNTDVSTGNV